MSCYEWEEGRIVLPVAEYKQVRDAVLVATRRHFNAIYEACQEFWKILPASAKRNPDLYDRWRDAFISGNDPTVGWFVAGKKVRNPAPVMHSLPTSLADDMIDVLYRCVTDGVPRRVRKTDIENPTNKTVRFKVGDEADIIFDRPTRSVRWSVAENNHAAERARMHPIAVAFFGALNRVHWTRGSGGTIVGDNEYNRDSYSAGGGANYVVAEYGPNHQNERRRGYGYGIGRGY